MNQHPVDELVVEINSFLRKHRSTLPDTEVELLQRSLDHLRLYRTAERFEQHGKSVRHVEKAIYWLIEFITESELPNLSELLDTVEQLL